MGTVDFHAVHADGLGILGGLGEGVDHVLDVLFGHAVHNDIAVLELFHRAISRHAGIRLSAHTAHTAHMPQLRNNLAAFGVDCIDHFLPASQGGFTVEMRHVGVAIGGWVPDHGAFSDDQAHTGSGTATVVLNDFRVGYATWGERAGHGRHDHAGRQLQCTELEGFEQGLDGHGTLHGRVNL